MNNEQVPLQAEYHKLAISGVRALTLKRCFNAKLSAIARKAYGRNDHAAAALGLHTMTLSKWNSAGRKVSIDEPLQATVERIAAAIFEPLRGKSCDGLQLVAEFKAGLAAAAVEITKGRRMAAGRMLGVGRRWMTNQYPQTDVQRAQAPRRVSA